MKPTHYQINVESFLRTDVLGDTFELPYSEGLEEAVLLINTLCNKRIQSIKKAKLEEFLSRKVGQIRQTFDVNEMKHLALALVNYDRDEKFKL